MLLQLHTDQGKISKFFVSCLHGEPMPLFKMAIRFQTEPCIEWMRFVDDQSVGIGVSLLSLLERSLRPLDIP